MDAWRRAGISFLVAPFVVVIMVAACSSAPVEPPDGSNGPPGESPTAEDNRAPTALAGPARTVAVGQPVELDGSASNDPDGDALAFSWTLEDVPDGATAALGTPTAASATFVPDVAGAYGVSLVVSDGSSEGSDTVAIEAIVSTGTVPTLSDIEDQRTTVGVAIEVPFTVFDEAPDSVTITVSSSDPTLVADGDLVVSGGGAERTLLIEPAPAGFGTTVITLLAQDDEGLQGTESFTVEVRDPFARQVAMLTPSDAADSDLFGVAVAIDGDYVVIGASGDDDDGALSGSAYVFHRGASGWVQNMKLPPSPPVVGVVPAAVAAGDEFGSSVSINGNHIIVGAPLDDGGRIDAGAAYIYRRCGRFESCSQPWSEVAILKASDVGPRAFFGHSVAIAGDVAFVGAPGAASFAGAVYVFQRTDDVWNQTARLSVGTLEAWFGSSVAVSGDAALVGAELDTVSNVTSGSAYVFRRSGSAWIQVAQLTSDDASDGDRFGGSVAINGERAVVGGDPLGGGGSAYTFQRSGESWIQADTLGVEGTADVEAFGWPVAISDEFIIVGARNRTTGVSSGNTYVFQRDDTEWHQVRGFIPDGVDVPVEFGWSVALTDDTALVGSPDHDDSGAVFVYGE